MSAALQTTQPLALGLNLEGGSATLTASALSIPVTMQNATLFGSTQGADLGITAPLTLGIMLGANNGNFAITASALSVPVTMQSATLTLSALPADTFDGTMMALPLGLLLGSSGLTLTCSALSVPVNLAWAESYEDQTQDGAPGYDLEKKRRYVYEANGRLVVTTNPTTALKAARGKPVEIEPAEPENPVPTVVPVDEVKELAQKYEKAPEVQRALDTRDYDRAYALYRAMWTMQDEEDIEALLMAVH